MASKVVEHTCNCTDETLLACIAQRDEAAYQLLYKRHAPRLFSILLSVTHEASVAEELLQECFYQVWQKADQFEARGLVTTWLVQIVRHKALDHLRRQRARLQTTDSQLVDFERVATPHHSSTEHAVEWHCTQQEIAAALAQLPSEQRTCLELTYFEGLSSPEIAAYTHLPLGTIKTRLRSGKAKVARLLRAAGYDECSATYPP